MKYLIVNTESFQSGEIPECVKSYIRKYRDPFIILDECFVAGTPVDTLLDGVVKSKPIETVSIGDSIKNAVGLDTVVGIKKTEVTKLVRIKAEGRIFTCSENHPFLTLYGWRYAKNIRAEDYLISTEEAMRILWGCFHSKTTSSEISEVLLKELLRSMADVESTCPGPYIYEDSEQEDFGVEKSFSSFSDSRSYTRFDKDKKLEAYVKEIIGGKDDQYEVSKRNTEKSTYTWRERVSYTRTCNKATVSTVGRMVSRIRSFFRETNSRLSDLLQARFSKHKNEVRYRTGRVLALREAKAFRCEEGLEAKRVRVDSVEILEQGSAELDSYRDAEGRIYCYDLKAAWHQSFSVNGVLVHNCSKIKSNRALPEAKKSKRTQSIRKLNKFGHRCILTGTFISKSPVNAWDQMEFLNKNYFGEDMYSFENKYCIMIRLPIGRGIRTLITEEIYNNIHKGLNKTYKLRGADGLQSQMEAYVNRFSISQRKLMWIMEHKEFSPFMNVEDVFKRIEPVCMIVKKKDALDIPDKVYKTISIPASPEMEKLYKQLVDTGFTDDIAVAGNGISMYHRLQDVVNGYIPVDNPDEEGSVVLHRQKSNIKIETLLDELDDIDLNEHQVVVWSNRKLFLHDIAESLQKEEISCAVYDGDTSQKDRAKIQEDFESGKLRVFLANQKSGSFGLDWIKSADYEIFCANDYSVETREQAEDRVHRGGIGDVKKTIIDIVVSGTVDEKVTANLKLGKELIHAGKTDKAVFAYEEVIF